MKPLWVKDNNIDHRDGVYFCVSLHSTDFLCFIETLRSRGALSYKASYNKILSTNFSNNHILVLVKNKLHINLTN